MKTLDTLQSTSKVVVHVPMNIEKGGVGKVRICVLTPFKALKIKARFWEFWKVGGNF